MARLTHPNTVEVFDYGHTEDGTFYYVMEYLPGLSLEGLVEADGPLMPGRVIFLLRQACEALAEAHSAGLIHRDLKPENIFATQRGGRYDFVKLLDFGLAMEVIGRAPAGGSRERASLRDSRIHGPRTGPERSATRSPLRPVRTGSRRLPLADGSSSVRG